MSTAEYATVRLCTHHRSVRRDHHLSVAWTVAAVKPPEVPAVPDMPTGQLIRLYRIDRKKSTVSVATHAGITVRYLEMIEAGTKTPSIDKLRKIAKVLGVRTSALLGEAPSEDHEGPVNHRLAEVERALFTYRSLALHDGGPTPELGELARQVNAGWDAWFTSPNKYSDVLRTLPYLIASSERAVHEHGRSGEACRQASEVYQLARPVLKHLGRVDLCGLVSDRAMRYAEETDDPLLIAAAIWNLGQAMLSDDMPSGALDVAMKGAEVLEPILLTARLNTFLFTAASCSWRRLRGCVTATRGGGVNCFVSPRVKRRHALARAAATITYSSGLQTSASMPPALSWKLERLPRASA